MNDGLLCEDLSKTYPGQAAPALGGADGIGVSLTVEKGEFFALLGPSGCGKTTLLKIIGGFVPPDRGSVQIDGTDVTGLPSYRRPTNTVFQSYALFPHMRLGANVSFGLQMAGVKGSERDRRTAQALSLVGLAGWEQRKVSELSGGQQQRAALARALVNRPSVLLLDEPLGALDLRLRRQMQDELVALKSETDTTFIHVTHDQEEACAMADRIAVMNQGRIVQVDTPEALYRSPRTTFVAEFIDVGTVLRGRVTASGPVLEVEADDMVVRGETPSWYESGRAVAAVLPHDRVRILGPNTDDPAPPGVLRGTVERVVFTGAMFNVYVKNRTGHEFRACLTESEAKGVSPGAAICLAWSDSDVIFVEDDAPNV